MAELKKAYSEYADNWNHGAGNGPFASWEQWLYALSIEEWESGITRPYNIGSKVDNRCVVSPDGETVQTNKGVEGTIN